MKWLSSLILLVLAILLFAFVFFWERKQPSSEEAAEKAKRLFTIEEKDLRWLEVDHDGTLARFERPGAAAKPSTGATGTGASGTGRNAAAAASPAEPSASAPGWRLVRPIEDRADPYLVDGLARRVAELQTVRTFAAGARLPSDADAGLQPPQYRIVFDAGAGAKTLLVGREAPATNAVFLRTPDGRTSLVSKSLVDGLDKPAADWRDRALFDFGAVDLASAEILRPSGPLRFRRDGEDWRLTAPVEDEAAGGKVQGLLSSIATLRAEEFQPETAAPSAGLQPPARQVRLTRRDGTVAELSVGGPVPGSTERVYARVPARPGIVEIAAHVVGDLDGSADSFRSLKLFTLSAWDAQSVTLVSRGETVELKRQPEKPGAASAAPAGPQWTAVRPAGLTPKADTVEALVNDLADLEAAEIAGPANDRAAWGLDAPAARAEITTAPPAPSGTTAGPSGSTPGSPAAGRREIVLFGKPAPGEGRVYAMREGRPWVLVVPAKILDRFAASALK